MAHHHLIPPPNFGTQRVLANAYEAIDLFSSAGVDLILSGHLHQAYIGNSEEFYPKGRPPVVILHSGTTTSNRGRGGERERNTCNWIQVDGKSMVVSHYRWHHTLGPFRRAQPPLVSPPGGGPRTRSTACRWRPGSRRRRGRSPTPCRPAPIRRLTGASKPGKPGYDPSLSLEERMAEDWEIVKIVGTRGGGHHRRGVPQSSGIEAEAESLHASEFPTDLGDLARGGGSACPPGRRRRTPRPCSTRGRTWRPATRGDMAGAPLEEQDRPDEPGQAVNALEAGSSVGRYRIVKFLGAGAMGEVYLAEDPQIERQLAIKTVRLVGRPQEIEDRKKRLLREARAAGRLLHPNVVTLFDAGEADGRALPRLRVRRGHGPRRPPGDGRAAAEPARGAAHRAARPPRPSTTPTARASSTATSSRATSCSTAPAG